MAFPPDTWVVSLLKFIGSRLCELRKRHGLTQEQAAILLGTDLKWYQRVEWSKKDVRASTIERLAALFGLSAVEFLSADVPANPKVKSRSPGAPHKPRKAKSRRTTTKAKK